MLLARQLVRSHVTSKNEIDELRGVIARDLADAAISALSSDRRFATAYNAALQTAKIVIACAGYRVAGLGHHQTTFEAAELAIGSQSATLMAFFDTCRRKRNIVDYDRHTSLRIRKLSKCWKKQNGFFKLRRIGLPLTIPPLR